MTCKEHDESVTLILGSGSDLVFCNSVCILSYIICPHTPFSISHISSVSIYHSHPSIYHLSPYTTLIRTYIICPHTPLSSQHISSVPIFSASCPLAPILPHSLCFSHNITVSLTSCRSLQSFKF